MSYLDDFNEQHSAEPTIDHEPFMSPEGLRALLERLHRAEDGAWRHDPEAEALMHYATTKYASLARSHGLAPEDAAHAAYMAMRATSTRTATDPWAVVTTAVRISLIAEERAHALLISPDRARRRSTYGWRDVQRFGERTDDFDDYHPALAASDSLSTFAVTDTETEQDTVLSDDSEARTAAAWQARRAVEGVITLLVVRGWPPAAARVAVDYVCNRLMRAGSRRSAYEHLRRDRTARAMLDMSQRDWITLLRLMLGHPTSPRMLDRYGALARLLLGDGLTDVLNDANHSSDRSDRSDRGDDHEPR